MPSLHYLALILTDQIRRSVSPRVLLHVLTHVHTYI